MTTPRAKPLLRLVVLTKPPVPGRVKTRLITGQPGGLSAIGAARVHAAMLVCITRRLLNIGHHEAILAVDGGRLDSPGALPLAAPAGWRVTDQGAGGLGQRLDHLWRSMGDGPLAFLGTDSPDVPMSALEAMAGAVDGADAAVGPVSDGGYWCLAARSYRPQLLRGIDWGTANVYHQTQAAAHRAGLTLAELPAWHDVDSPEDLQALRLRLRETADPHLARLAHELAAACDPEPQR